MYDDLLYNGEIMEKILTSLSDTEEVAKAFAQKLPCPAVVAFTGELGAGKTTFIKYLCKHLGYEGDVTSPTFTIMNCYEGKYPIYHYDMYRLSGADALYDIGYYDYEESGISLIEWSENVREGLPRDIITVDLKYHGENRKITISENIL